MRIRWVLRLLGWNALLLLAGVVLIAIVGEAWFRLSRPLSMPFRISDLRSEFVPNVGVLYPPNTEIRSTNRFDYWNVSRTNSLGFLDREPPPGERAAATCHISMIGDSFVETRQVPIDDKFHVRLEALAADELPHLDITTSAFGVGGTGQGRQLALYDEYARLLHPKLLVLVFVDNDFSNNMSILRAWDSGYPLGPTVPMPGVLKPRVRRRPDGKLELTWFLKPRVRRRPDGKLELTWFSPGDQPPLPLSPGQHPLPSEFVDWLRAKMKALLYIDPRRINKDVRDVDALQYTRFAMEQFKQRADRDGVNLVILASHTLKLHGTIMFERMSKIAASLDIPVIDQADYILRQGSRLTDAQWKHDGHWNVAGHRWAAEALLEYIEEHPAICDRPT